MREPAPFGKVMGAFLVASIAASLLAGAILWLLFAREAPLSAFTDTPAILFYALVLGFPFAFGHALVLGLPAYLWLERRYRLHWWNAMASGAVVGVVPMLIWIGPASAWEGIALLLIVGASGAGGGLVFRLALYDLMRKP